MYIYIVSPLPGAGGSCDALSFMSRGCDEWPILYVFFSLSLFVCLFDVGGGGRGVDLVLWRCFCFVSWIDFYIFFSSLFCR